MLSFLCGPEKKLTSPRFFAFSSLIISFSGRGRGPKPEACVGVCNNRELPINYGDRASFKYLLVLRNGWIDGRPFLYLRGTTRERLLILSGLLSPISLFCACVCVSSCRRLDLNCFISREINAKRSLCFERKLFCLAQVCRPVAFLWPAGDTDRPTGDGWRRDFTMASPHLLLCSAAYFDPENWRYKSNVRMQKSFTKALLRRDKQSIYSKATLNCVRVGQIRAIYLY